MAISPSRGVQMAGFYVCVLERSESKSHGYHGDDQLRALPLISRDQAVSDPVPISLDQTSSTF
jgi:hypothetical protein